jgi:hypothetical protein
LLTSIFTAETPRRRELLKGLDLHLQENVEKKMQGVVDHAMRVDGVVNHTQH